MKTKIRTIQNLWDTAKHILRGKFIAKQSYLREWEKSQINNVTSHLKQPEKGQTKPKVSKRKEIKDQGRNKWNRDKENNRKDQWN